jgi:H/ACA ribonucleoprotein complex subunit 4
MKKKHLLPFDKKQKRLVLKKTKINPKYGKKPDEYTIEELLENSIINLDKPCGPTSHQIDSWIKKILQTEKIGHGGTLDPKATGVLPIGVKNATKLLQFLLPAGKEYIALMKIHKDVDKKKIKDVCKKFTGEITQLPPVRSAVKRMKRKRKIYYLEVLEIKKRDILIKVGCESGTYIRTLIVDIGKKLGTKAHMVELRRTRVGNISEKDSYYLQDLKDALVFYKKENNDKYLKEILKPAEEIFDFLPNIIIADSAVDAICHGANLMKPGILEIDSEIQKNDLVLIKTQKGEAVAIAKAESSIEDIVKKEKGICASLEKVIMKKDTYPSFWKKT